MLETVLKAWKKVTGGSINRQIFAAAVIVALMTVFVKIAAVAKELVVAWRFGTGDELDAFLIALVIPDFIITVVAGSFNAALIPTYVRVKEQQGLQKAQKLFSGVMIWSLGLLGITTIVMMAAAPVYLPLLASGFEPQKLDLTLHLLWAIAPSVLLSGIITIWSAVLNAGERFALAAVSPILTPAITILLILGFRFWGIFALAAGLVCGAIGEIIILGVALHRQRISLLPKWSIFDGNLRQVISQYMPLIAGAFLFCSTTLVDQSMAAMLLPGSVAALNYGNRIIALPITLTATALSTAVIPYFSQMVSRQDWTGVLHTLKKYLRLIFIVTVLLTGLILIFSRPIVELVFQRGSFTAEDSVLVAQIQACYALQIPFYVANILVVRMISALLLNYILVYENIVNLIANICLNYVFMQKIGIAGIALSTSCVYFICFLMSLSALLFFLKKYRKVN